MKSPEQNKEVMREKMEEEEGYCLNKVLTSPFNISMYILMQSL